MAVISPLSKMISPIMLNEILNLGNSPLSSLALDTSNYQLGITFSLGVWMPTTVVGVTTFTMEETDDDPTGTPVWDVIDPTPDPNTGFTKITGTIPTVAPGTPYLLNNAAPRWGIIHTKRYVRVTATITGVGAISQLILWANAFPVKIPSNVIDGSKVLLP